MSLDRPDTSSPGERVGKRAGLALILGALALIIGELWHPAPPHTTFELLQAIAANDNWQFIHIQQLFGVALLTFGIVEATALAGRAAQMRVAISAVLGGTILVAALALDGIAFKDIADAFVHAPATSRDAIDSTFGVVLSLQGALLNVGALFLFGMSVFAAGGIIARTGNVRVAARAGQVIGALVGIVALDALANVGRAALPWYPFAVLLTSAWALWMGVVLWREGRASPLHATHAPLTDSAAP